MERIMNDENDLDQDVEGDALDDPVACVSRNEVVKILTETKSGKYPGLYLSFELMAAKLELN